MARTLPLRHCGQNEGTIVVQPAKIFSAKYTKNRENFDVILAN